jgi:hypothetical protein
MMREKSKDEQRADALKRLRDQLKIASSRGIGRSIALPPEVETEYEYRAVAALHRTADRLERLNAAVRGEVATHDPKSGVATAVKAAPKRALPRAAASSAKPGSIADFAARYRQERRK